MRHSNFIEGWIEQAEKQARQQALQEGLQEGLQQGLQQKAHAILVQLLTAKFGKLPRTVERQVRSITSEAELDQLCLRVLTASNLDEMKLNGKKR